jgi:hypothetical protein
VWDIKCDDMGWWTNQGRKPMGTMADKYDTYRQSYTHSDLPSLKKWMPKGPYRYMYVQYVFSEGTRQLTLKALMHAIIDHRGGIKKISSSGEYPRNRLVHSRH